MPGPKFFSPVNLVVALLFTLFGMTGMVIAQEQVLYSFYDSGGTVLPQAGLTSDAAGNLYGTTFYSGANGMGMVYELTPTSGGWQETVLHSFSVDGIDGFFPTGGVIFDAAGNLYGTTEFGGSGNCSVGFGCGTIFKLSPNGNGGWTETILHEFNGSDGWQSHSGLIFDAAGNLYGTTANGGNYGQGTIYKLSPGKGAWTLNTLYHFTGGTDGGVPWGALISDALGNLYGMTSAGGGATAACRYGCGTVFELVRARHWMEKVVHNFSTHTNDGAYPSGSLVLDAAGNLYGAAGSGGGSHNAGIVFQLKRESNGQWAEKVLHNFNNTSQDGSTPSANLIFDSAGNLYSTTLGGGTGRQGTVFELIPEAGGGWSETILYNFSGGADGSNPSGGLIFDASGNLYGSTAGGGVSAEGAVFKIVP